MILNRSLLLILILLSSSPPSLAQRSKDWPLDAPKNSTIVLKISSKLLGVTKVSRWSGKATFGANIEQKEATILVEGTEDWKSQSWPLMKPFQLAKVNLEKQHTEVELHSKTGNVKLKFLTSVQDVGAAFSQVAYAGTVADFELSDYYKAEVLNRLLPIIFQGPLAELPRQTQNRTGTGCVLRHGCGPH